MTVFLVFSVALFGASIQWQQISYDFLKCGILFSQCAKIMIIWYDEKDSGVLRVSIDFHIWQCLSEAGVPVGKYGGAI